MIKDHAEQIMVAVLNDMVRISIPRMLSIQHKLEKGETLSGSEIEFFSEMLNKLSRCNREYKHDNQCMSIFACIAHLLFTVVNRALENEQDIPAAITDSRLSLTD